MNRLLHATVLAFASTLILAAPAWAETVLSVKVFQVSPSVAATQKQPDIDGRTIVWVDNRLTARSPAPVTWDVWSYNLDTGQEQRVTPFSGDYQRPAVSGQDVVYIYRGDHAKPWEDPDPYLAIACHSLAGVPTRDGRVMNGARWGADPLGFSDRRVVWGYDDSYGGCDVLMYDVGTGVPSLVTDTHDVGYDRIYEPRFPDISGNTVVFLDDERRVWGANLTTHALFSIDTRQDLPDGTWPNDGPPSVSGDVVVWTKHLSSCDVIRGYNLVSKKKFVIATSIHALGDPKISGNLVLWSRLRNGLGTDVEACDLATGDVFPVPGCGGVEAFSDNTAVWTDNFSRILAAAINLVDWDHSLTINAGDAWTGSPNVSLTCTASSSGAPVSEMRLSSDGQAWGPWEPYQSQTTWQLPLGDGVKHVYVQFRDEAGNATSASAVGSIVLDTQSPRTTVSFGGLYHRYDAPVRFTASDALSGVAFSEYQLDGSGWEKGPSLMVPVSANHTSDGLHVVTYRSTDNAGNVESVRTASVVIDTIGPRGKAPYRASVFRGRTARLRYQVNDVLSPRANVTIRIKKLGRTVKTLTPGCVATNKLLSRLFVCWLRRGDYRFYVYAKDLAGNRQIHVGVSRLTVK